MADSTSYLRSGKTEAIVIVKAVPHAGTRHGETVCCAGIDLHGNWLRLYPVSFRTLEDGKRFGRWDRIQFRWRMPKDDTRRESRRVDQDTISIVGKLKRAERERFLANRIVTSLDREREEGRSLALLKAEITEFVVENKTTDEIFSETGRFKALRAQADLFNTKQIIPYSPCPYRFKYRYRTDDGTREGTCQDWETEATYFNWNRTLGEQKAIDQMRKCFGEDYPKKGMLLAMGTHSRRHDQWLINGVVRLDEVAQLTLL